MKKLHNSVLLALTILTSPYAWASNADNAVILLYHHVSSTTPASTSVTPTVFEQHLQYLADGYNVISLEQAVKALKAGQLLPERTVVITFDDGYCNIYANEALPVSVDGYTVTVTLDKTLPIGRSRVNCTAPSRAQPGRYYWYSQPWFVADRDGKYPD